MSKTRRAFYIFVYIDGKETIEKQKWKKKENLGGYKHRCKESEGRMEKEEEKIKQE